MSLVIKGTIVALANDRTVAANETTTFSGRLWIGDDGRIAAVTKGAAKGPLALQNAPQVDCGTSLVMPGLIDLHSHLGYAALPLWTEPNRVVPFLHHDIWPGRPTYAESVTWPAYAMVTAAPAEALAYAEVRALIGGTTSIQGSPPSNHPLDGWMVRNVEDESFGGEIDRNRVQSSVLTLKADQLGEKADRMRHGVTFIYHCAEGQRGSIVAREFTNARSAGCLQKNFVAIHCSANDDFSPWHDAGTVVWSPFSNLWLYGSTTDVPALLARGVRLCVGSDWGPSGTKHVLAELKVASQVAAANGWALSAFDLVKMVTVNPGEVLTASWDRTIGRLQPGAVADVTVLHRRSAGNPFDSIVAATEADVALVVIGGRPRYGDHDLMTAAQATLTGPIDIAGRSRLLALNRFDEPTLPWSWEAVMAQLEVVRADPKKAIDKARHDLAGWIGHLDDRRAPLRLALDMPTGVAPIGGLPKDLGQVKIVEFPSLVHDAVFFESVHGRGFHGGQLDHLAEFYR